MKIHITESQFKELLERVKLNEDNTYPQGQDNEISKKGGPYYVDPKKVGLVVDFINQTFVRGTKPVISSEGYPKLIKVVGLKGPDGNPFKDMSAEQMFYMLQDKFFHLYANMGQRDKLLKLIIKDWYEDRIKNNLLSQNVY